MTGETVFSTVLRPSRSLRLKNLQVVVIIIAVIWFVVGLLFALAGAWPVIGFLGLEVVLLYFALTLNLRRGRAHETINLTDDELVVSRINHWGQRQNWTFQPYWLRVELERPPGRRSRLSLISHGESLVVGAFLPPAERELLAYRLREALARIRGGNPQPESPSTSRTE